MQTGKEVYNMATAADVLKYAKAWVGCNEKDGSFKQIIDTYNAHSPRARGYKVQYSDEWCATFVSACAIKAGAAAVIPLECSCNYMIQGFKNIGRWVEDDAYLPKPGDIIFYDWQDSGSGDNKGSSDQVGIVESVSGGYITVIEGNKSEVVARRVIKVNGRFIRGFGVPAYDNAVNNQYKPEIKALPIIYYNNTTEVQSVNIDGNNFVKLRDFAKLLDLDVLYDPETKAVRLKIKT